MQIMQYDRNKNMDMGTREVIVKSMSNYEVLKSDAYL